MILDFRKFDGYVEVWGPDEEDGHWFHFGTIDTIGFSLTEEVTISLPDLKEIVAYMERP